MEAQFDRQNQHEASARMDNAEEQIGATERTSETGDAASSVSNPSSSEDPGFGASPFSIKLEFFSGPMDLLLHLVAQQEVSIENVRMSVIAEQYLEIVSEAAHHLDLETATEYLVIAATLLAIKSRSLLPIEQAAEPEEEQADTWEDSRFFEDLRARLKAYEETKQRAEELMEHPQLGVDTFRRIDRKALQPTPEMLAEPEDVQTLATMFMQLVKRVGGSKKSFRVAFEPISVVSYMMRIVDYFSLGSDAKNSSTAQTLSVDNAVKEPTAFTKLLRRFLPPTLKQQLQSEESRREALEEVRGIVIGSFIASLELVKRGVVSAKPIRNEKDLSESRSFILEPRLSSTDDKVSLDTLDSEFDHPAKQADNVAEEPTAEKRPSQHEKVVHIADYRTPWEERGRAQRDEESQEPEEELRVAQGEGE